MKIWLSGIATPYPGVSLRQPTPESPIHASMGYAPNIGVPFSVARISPGGLKVLDVLISMNLIQLSA
jgi:hypothetical protein